MLMNCSWATERCASIQDKKELISEEPEANGPGAQPAW